MLPNHIKSLQHPIVKKIVKLRKDKHFRYLEGYALVIGEKVIFEIAKKNPPFIFLSVDNNLKILASKQKISITTQVMHKIAGIKTQEKLAALFPIPKTIKISNEKAILTIDEVKDPGNLGTLFRSALALNFDAIILINNTADPYNDKVIRSSKGAIFSLPFCSMEKTEFIQLTKEKNITPYVADMNGYDIKKIKVKHPFSLILSNESKGKGMWPENFTNVAILMNKSSESLNVATSGSILMYVMTNG
jgi:RNA methyltransferase, TrmH family